MMRFHNILRLISWENRKSTQFLSISRLFLASSFACSIMAHTRRVTLHYAAVQYSLDPRAFTTQSSSACRLPEDFSLTLNIFSLDDLPEYGNHHKSGESFGTGRRARAAQLRHDTIFVFGFIMIERGEGKSPEKKRGDGEMSVGKKFLVRLVMPHYSHNSWLVCTLFLGGVCEC
jgi:hypothetical protein